MLGIRLFEEALLGLFSRGHIRGTVHTCIGQEACAVGVVGALDRNLDIVSSNHRGHGHFLAFTGNKRALLAEILGYKTGICGGRGGSQHLHSKNFFSNGILGGMLPVATGIAMGQKRDRAGGISVVFSGDGAMGEGVVYESLNIASLWGLPLLLVIEHNKIAQSTPWELGHACPIDHPPAAFGVRTTVIDGNDIFEVRITTERIIANMRVTPAPHCLVLETYRLGPHSKGDDTRAIEEIESSRLHDPLSKASALLPVSIVNSILRDCQMELSDLLSEFDIS